MTRSLPAMLTAALLLAAPAAAQTLDRLASTGEIRLAVRADAAPLSYDRDGAPAGYTVELCRAVAARLAPAVGRERLVPVFVTVTAEDRFEAISEGRADLLCGAASVTLGRRESVDFSIPVFIDGASVMTLRDGPGDFAALAGKRIGVRAGTTTETALAATLRATGMAAETVPVGDHDDGLGGLLDGRLDAYFADQSILMRLARDSDRRGELQVSGNVLTVEPHALALPLGDHAFRREVDRALSRLYRSGELAAIFDASFAPAVMGDAMRALVVVAPIPE